MAGGHGVLIYGKDGNGVNKFYVTYVRLNLAMK